MGSGIDGLMLGSGMDGSGREALTEGSGSDGSRVGIGRLGIGSDGSGSEGSGSDGKEMEGMGAGRDGKASPEASPLASCSPAASTTATRKISDAIALR